MKSLLYVFIIVTNVYCKYNCALKYKNSKTREKYNFSVSLFNLWVHKSQVPSTHTTEFFTTEPTIYGSCVWKGCSAAHSDNEFIENKFVIKMYNKPDDDLTYCKLHNTRDEACK